MADDADVTSSDGEITLDDFNSDEQDTTKADSSPAKEEAKADSKEPEVAKDTKDEVQADDTATDSEESPKEEGEPEKEAEDTEDKPLSKADERKAQLNTEIRDLVSQRNALKAEVEKANAEVYQPATESELVDQGYTATDAKVEALRQAIEMKDYNDKVADAQLTLSSESMRVLNDFKWADSESEDYDQELANEAANLLQANLIYDPNTGQEIGSNVSPYQLYQTLDKARGISATKGQIKGREDTEKMLANADTASSAAPPKVKEDPLIALWKED